MVDDWDRREVVELLEELRKHGCISSDIRDEVDQLVEEGAIYDALRLILDSR